VVELVAQASVLVFLVLFTWSGVRLTVNNIPQYGMQLRISMAYVYVLLPLGGVISLVVVLTYFWQDVLRLLGRDAA
jgi:TRAP-type C4-dicarboxylate transport system permease small subunit